MNLEAHTQHDADDLAYLRAKGWTDAEIQQRWDQEGAAGKQPCNWVAPAAAGKRGCRCLAQRPWRNLTDAQCGRPRSRGAPRSDNAHRVAAAP